MAAIDPQELGLLERAAAWCSEVLMPLSATALPALMGAVIAEMRRKPRRDAAIKMLASIVMSTICGCGLTPLFSHMLQFPPEIAASVAFFLGYAGLGLLDTVRGVVNTRMGADRDAGTHTPDNHPHRRASDRDDRERGAAQAPEKPEV